MIANNFFIISPLLIKIGELFLKFVSYKIE
jgi:hypothetical protein